jgi:hypothetical protein
MSMRVGATGVYLRWKSFKEPKCGHPDGFSRTSCRYEGMLPTRVKEQR